MGFSLSKDKSTLVLDHLNGSFSVYELQNGNINRTAFRGPRPDVMGQCRSVAADSLAKELESVLGYPALSVVQKLVTMVKAGNHIRSELREKQPTDTSKLIAF